jgi:hypothetical protein
MYSWNHLTVLGAAAPTSSKLLVDNVLKMKMPPIEPTAVHKYNN